MEPDEDDTLKTSPGPSAPEPVGSAAVSPPQPEPGPAAAHCEPQTETAAQLEEPPRNDAEEDSLPGIDPGESAGDAGKVVRERSEAGACMEESTAAGERELVGEPSVAGTAEKEEDSPARGGDDVLAGESGTVVLEASTPQVQLPLLPVSESGGGDEIGGEESEAAGDVTESEPAAAGVEEMKCSEGVEADKKDKEETAFAESTDALEDSRVVEETGKETSDVAHERVEEETKEDHWEEEEIEDHSESGAGEIKSEATQGMEPPHSDAVANEMETAHEKADGEGAEVVEIVPVVAEEDGADQKKEAEEAAGDINVVHLEADVVEAIAVKEDAELAKENAGGSGVLKDSRATDTVEVEAIAAENDVVADAEEAAGENRIVDDDMGEAEMTNFEGNIVAGSDKADEAVMDATAAAETEEAARDNTKVDDCMVKVELKMTENVIEDGSDEAHKAAIEMVAEAEEAAWDNRQVDDDMVDAEMKTTESNIVAGDDEAREATMDERVVDEDVEEEANKAVMDDREFGEDVADEAEKAVADNREVDKDAEEEAHEAATDEREGDKDVAEEVEADAPEDMEVLHEDTDATEEETDATEEAERAEEMSRSGAGMKRKRGRAPKASTPRTRKKMEEDVCFVCFDGGDLVLCDRRGCPKAYHPSCVNRDEAFFRTKGQWNCGWHLCSNCGKNAYYMCYTCTYSLCKTCITDGSISCIRRNKGFCQTCMKTIMMIEDNLKGGDGTGQVDFDDKSSWEYLFKDYYMDLKERLSLTPAELARATNRLKGSDELPGKQDSPREAHDDSQNSAGDTGVTVPKRRQSKRQAKSNAKRRDSRVGSDHVGSGRASIGDKSEWASKELMEFVMHMRNGDGSYQSQYDVQELLLAYIKKNKLRDPKRKSHVVCDQRLQNLFGKPRVGHFEMLKILESHYFLKEDADDLQGTVVDTDANQSELDGNFDVSQKAGRDKRRKARKKGDERGFLSNRDDYAAIDTHNVNLMYLRRNLLEDLIEDAETFHDKVVGAFVRIRISGNNQKQDMYRLVPVVGTSKAPDQYKVGKRMTDFLLEILNLKGTEVISIDTISNQEFTEDECKRLRQSIKCGLINRLTVGDVQEKAIALQTVRVKDWLESETVRLSHLRDRASDMGRRKELRECVEKLQLLKTPEERQRRLEEVPEIHGDPKMDPSYESEEDEAEADDKRQETYVGGTRGNTSFRGREPISPQKGGSSTYDSWSSASRTTPMTPIRELSRNLSSRGLASRGDDYRAETVNGSSSWGQVKERETSYPSSRDNMNIHVSSSVPEIGASRTISSTAVPEAQSVGPLQIAPKINESEKMWHYQDPAGKIHGPFSMVQLRKWNNTGYFPADLKIWKTTEGQEDSILLTDALNGKFQRDPPSRSNLEQARGTLVGRAALSSVEIPKHSGGEWSSSGSGTNLPSPTPGQTAARSTNVFSLGIGGAQAPASASSASHSLSQGVQKPEIGMLLGSTMNAPSQFHSQATVPRESYSNQVVGLHNLVQAVVRNQSQSNPVHAEAVTPSSVHRSEPTNMPTQAQVQGSWPTSSGTMPSIQSYAPHGSSGYANNPWRQPGSTDLSNVQSAAPLPNMNWPSGNNNSSSSSSNASNNYGASTQNTGWTPMQGNVGWTAAPVPGNTTINWGAPTQGAPGGNPTWPAQGQVQTQAQGNPAQMGWAQTSNPNPGYAAPGQGPASVGSNPTTWASPGSQNGDGYQRNKPWNRQSSFGSGSGGGGGGGSGGGASRLGGWCRFFRETGHCKKGASCNYKH